MASGSKPHGSGSRIEAPSRDNSLNGPELNPEFEAMSAAELIDHLIRSRRTSDFVDAALVFTAREHRLAKAEDLVDKLHGKIEAHEYNALEAMAQIRWAAETKMGLRAEIRVLQLRATDAEARSRHGSSIIERRLTQQASRGLSSIKEAYGEELDREVLEDVLESRVIEGRKVPKDEAPGEDHKVPKEEAQDEDMVMSHHRRWLEKQAAKVIKKACRQKAPSFYKLVLNALLEKQELLLEKEKEKAAKEAAAT